MPPAIDTAFESFVQPNHTEQDSHSMPDLQSVSDSSESDGSADEVEMMPELQPIDDDNDSTWTSDEENDDLPPLEPIVGNRRARVEDDHDEDRDRRHPAERTGGARGQPTANANQNQGNDPPFFAGINRPQVARPPDMFDLFRTFMGAAGPPPNGAQPANAGANPNPPRNAPQNRGVPPPTGPLHFTFDFTEDFGPPPLEDTGEDEDDDIEGIAGPPGFFEILLGQARGPGGDVDGQGNFTQFQAFLERLGTMGQAFGFPMEEEKEDPERAKRLVAGLEVVPVGLVRRMEQVGGAPGAHVDDSTGKVEAPGCAICWDTLLDAEGEGFTLKESEQDTGPAATAAPVSAGNAVEAEALTNEQSPILTQHASESDDDPPTPIVNGGPADPVVGSTATTESQNTADKEEPHKIVCLPCAHVFHASCLIPWFSRPRQTTCPTCRFNIDPENLTYTLRPRPQPRPPQTAPGGPTAVPAGGAPATANVPGSAPGNAAANAPRVVPFPFPFIHADGAIPPNGNAPQAQQAPPANPPNVNAGGNNLPPGGFVFEGLPAFAQMFGGAGGDAPGPQFMPTPPPNNVPGQFQPAGAPPGNAPPNVNAAGNNPPPPGGFRGIPAFAQMFGGNGGPPLQFIPIPTAGRGQAFAAGFVGPAFQIPVRPPRAPQAPPLQPTPTQVTESLLREATARRSQQQPPQAPQQPPHTPQQSQPQPQQPPHAPAGNPGQGPQLGNGVERITVDFRLFANSPFEGTEVRRQTHVFANQIFGAEGGGDPPAPAAGGGGPQLPPDFNFAAPPRMAPNTPGPRPAPVNMPFPGMFTPQPQRRSQPRERKQWTLPPAPGPTLRSRVEQREREAGLRCSDISCGIGPSDEDPFPKVSDASMKQLSIRPLPRSSSLSTSVCSHTFHPACLVSAERVAGWGGEDKEGEQVEVACPTCRTIGCVSKEEWAEGVHGLA